MVRHVVMWKFRPGCEAQAAEFMEKLAALQGVIPEIRAMQVVKDASGREDYYSAMLISDFDSFEDLNTYQNDPRHKAVSALCKEIRESRAAVDYMVD